MVRLTSSISRLQSRRILVVGDLMLDTYTIGKARRISPEAPVAVVQVKSEEHRLGGAGNVILNLKALGAEVSLIGRIGSDLTSDLVREALAKEKIDLGGLFLQQGFYTPMKNRIISDNQQIVRIDRETIIPLPEMLEQEIIDALPELIEGIEAIAISDYGKGFLSKTLLSAVIEHAKKRDIPVITDPKGTDFTKYQGTTIIKPNLLEAYAAAGLQPDANLDLAAQRILELANAQTLMVTRSEAGLSVFHRNGERFDFPVRVREIKDVTGAGDTVLAMLTYATANGLSIAEAAQLSNVAAGIVLEHTGCASVRLSELARRLLEIDLVNKIFDQEHLFALQEALKEKEYILLGLSSREGMTSSIFSTIHQLAKDKEKDLVIFLCDEEPESDFISLLASLHDVKFIVTQSDKIASLCEHIPPAEVHAVIGEQWSKLISLQELSSLAAPY